VESKATGRFVRISPSKLHRVVDLIRGLDVSRALEILRFLPQRGGGLVAKVLKSALANAETTQRVDIDKLYVKAVMVGGAGMWKRFLPRAMGRTTRVRKRLSHITIVVDERQD
jgi:large subunit ribosomal protein L22